MKFFVVFSIFLFECVLQMNCYKILDSDFIPNEFYLKSKRYLADADDILYPSNRQGNLFDDQDDSNSFKQTLAALAAAAEAEENQKNSNYFQTDSTEFNSNELPYQNDDFDANDEETESHSSLVAGHQYVSGGAGEGKQYLHPDGSIANKEEIKSDEDLPAYCDPPNPCPIGYTGEECDSRPYTEFTAEFSKNYQEQQNCMCDDDHNDCKRAVHSKSNDRIADFIKNLQISKADDQFSAVVAKKSPIMKRSVFAAAQAKNLRNQYIKKNQMKIQM